MKLANAWLMALFLLLSMGPASASPQSDAEAQVVAVNSRIFQILQQNKPQLTANPASITALVELEIIPFVDFEAMSKLTLGKHWRTATPSQRTRFGNAYKTMLIRTYASRMLDYAGAKISVIRSVEKKKDYVSVYTNIQPVGFPAENATFDARLVNGRWKAYNVTLKGIDLITNFRTNFTREISASGIEALIKRLESTGA
jgi:phospholipid transport system substrate-binding protein